MDGAGPRDGGRISRRTLLTAGAASLGMAAMGVRPSIAQSKKGGGGGEGSARNALYLPPVIAASGTLTAARTKVVLSPTHTSNAGMTYASDQVVGSEHLHRTPGPTFVAARGGTAAVTFANNLGEPSTVHWHGMVVPTDQDGQPREVVPAGTSRTYSFKVDQRASFAWYHPHPHHLVSPQVSMGLAGGFIIRDAEDTGAQGRFPAGRYEVPLVIRDGQLDSSGHLQYKPSSNGYLGSTALVNGTSAPFLAVDRTWYRLRILIGSPARVFRLAFADGRPMRLIGTDGGLLPTVTQITEALLGPAERIDVLVDLTGLGQNQTAMLRDLAAGWDLLELRGTGAAGPAYTPLAVGATLSSVPTLAGPSQPTRTFSFDGMSRINGLIHDLNRIDFRVPHNTVERWRFTTGGNAPHPVHVHGGHFQVVSRSRGRATVYPWERGWKDTVLLEKGEIVDVLIRFDDMRTKDQRYLLHCHQLEHEDSGMMMNFEVI